MNKSDYRILLTGVAAVLALIVTVPPPAMAQDCLECHPDVASAFGSGSSAHGATSHHVQGTVVSGRHCYACHWEAREDGSINPAYHSTGTSGAEADRQVDLVVWSDGGRPIVHSDASTAVSFRSSRIGTPGERSAIAAITTHCLGCHSDSGNEIRPFPGDPNSPRRYAWDRQSIAARYLQKGTVPWGKYSTAMTNRKIRVTKAYSAHGNSAANAGGWSISSGHEGDIPNNWGGSGAQNVECFDCHNSHGSTIPGITSSYRTDNGSNGGALLKETKAGRSGYAAIYQPSRNTDAASSNPYTPGAGLCFDCHETATPSAAVPWGYNATFGASQPIIGYKDTPRFGPGVKGSNLRFSSRKSRTGISSSHLKSGRFLAYSASGRINGLCTPCHDPHGVSPTLASVMPYAVPLLKGGWLTSPYRDDAPPSGPTQSSAPAGQGDKKGPGSFWKGGGGSPRQPVAGMKYYVDRNTLGENRTISENEDSFGGLCLGCHSRTSLSGENAVGSVHKAVKGWGSNREHAFPCSKCHQPHNSGLPRLMQTNCFEAGPPGLRESSGLPWMPARKEAGQSNARDVPSSDTAAAPKGNRQVVGCHVRQFGGTGSAREAGQWQEKSSW